MAIHVGDVVYNKGTGEEGRVLRTVEIEDGIGYVVSVEPHSNWSMPATEALWPKAEVKPAGAQRVRS